jgi:hypothetical protein
MKNPNTSGQTIPIIIRTKNSSGIVVDENSTDAYATITTTSSAIMTPTISTAAGGAAAVLSATMNPNLMVPEDGFISITVPVGFTVAGSTVATAGNCKSAAAGDLLANSQSCAYDAISRVIKLKLLTTAGSKFLVNTTSQFSILSGLTNPTIAGDYVFDVATRD